VVYLEEAAMTQLDDSKNTGNCPACAESITAYETKVGQVELLTA
jgi:hypothetical protein